MIKKVITGYHKWIDHAFPCTPDQLGLYRILYAVIIIFLVGLPKYTARISGFPDGIYNPPPFFSFFFTEFPPMVYFQITDIIIGAGFLAVLLGFLTRISGVITATLIIINNGFIFSSGKIDHSFLVWFTLLLLSFSGWGQRFSVDSRLFIKMKDSVHLWTLSLLSMALGFGFFTAGLIKLVSGWLSLSDSMLRAFYLRNFYIQQKQDYLASWFEHFNFSPFWELGDWFTIIFEIAFLLIIFNPVLFRFFTCLAIFFHGLILLMMNIAFAHYLAIYLTFWMPLFPEKWMSKWKGFFQTITERRIRGVTVLGVVALVYLLVIFFGTSFQAYIRDGFLIIAFLFVLYVFLWKPRILFTAASDVENVQVIRFDGFCNLCNSFIQFALKRDVDKAFQFGVLQDRPLKTAEYETVELHTSTELLTKSSAFLAIVRRLNGFWPYLYLGVILPKRVRDLVYDVVARNRYKWFGKKDACMMPTEDIKNRFV